jgi:hypothetical protein
MAKEKIVVHSSAEENGMATMLAELMRTNIASSWYKSICFNLLSGSIGVRVPDAEVSATLVFSHGSCVVYEGIAGEPELTIEADSENLLALSNINLVAGLPFYLDENGRDILLKSLTGQVKIDGKVLHPLSLTLLTIVLSVN